MKKMINEYLNEIASGKAFIEENANCGFLTNEQIERMEEAKKTIRLNKKHNKMIKNLTDMAFILLQQEI